MALFDALAWMSLVWLLAAFWVFRGEASDWAARRAARSASASVLRQGYFVSGAFLMGTTLVLGIWTLLDAGAYGAAALVGFLGWRSVVMLRKRRRRGA